MNENIIRWALGLLTISVVALCTWVMNTNSELAVLKDNIITQGSVRMSLVEQDIANDQVQDREMKTVMNELRKAVQKLNLTLAERGVGDAN